MIRICLPTGSQHGWGVAGSRLIAELAKITEIGAPTDASLPLLITVSGPNFLPIAYLPAGPKNIGYAFIEQPSACARYLHNYKTYYTNLICGSGWMAQRMEEIGIGNPLTIVQGIDYDLFRPAPATEQDRPFTVFSGGKFEYRKGQDIVLAAMKVFMERHADARLIAAWGNHWPTTMRSMESSRWIKYQHVSNDWVSQVRATMEANGIPANRVMIPSLRDNDSMAQIYREAHIGLFPNRCEAGTNLVMCEVIASGVPVIASYATGHMDVFRKVDAMLLRNGKTRGPDGWWEPNDLDEILAYLEVAYVERDLLTNSGASGAGQIREHIPAWDVCAKEFLEVLEAE